MAKKPPKFEALVVNAIRRLQAAQGSTETEIANYISQEYNVTGPEVRKQIQLTLRRGMNYGILHKSKRGYVTCDRNIPDVLDVAECSSRRCSRRRGGKRKSARRGRSKSRSKRRKRGGCSSCPRRRAITAGIRTRSSRVKKMTRRRNAPRLARERSKAKKTNNDETPSNRQTTNNNSSSSRSSSKTPVRGKDEDGNNQS